MPTVVQSLLIKDTGVSSPPSKNAQSTDVSSERAIASRPSTAMRGYLLGGLAWFAVPFCFATTLGLVAIALREDVDYPTYPSFLTSSQVGAGLPAPAAAYALLGTGGAVAMLIVLFMAVTSALSSELIAVSSILTFDIYKIYINPSATGSTLVKTSHAGIVLWAIVCAVGACIWQVIGLDLGWLYNFMGIIIGPSVINIFYALTWSKQPKIAMIIAPTVGLASGLAAWLATAAALHDGVVTIETTGTLYAQLAGNLTSICIGGIVATIISLLFPANYSFEGTRNLNTGHTTSTGPLKNNTAQQPYDEKVSSDQEVKEAGTLSPIEKEQGEISDVGDDDEELEDPAALRRAVKIAGFAGVILTLILVLIFPLPLFLSHYTFSEGFFTFWIVLGIAWAFVSTFITVVLPIYESWSSMSRVFSGISADLRGKRVNARAE